MPKPLVFMMGQAPVFLPVDRQYARNHMWAVAADGGFRWGFSGYAVKLLGDARHLEWSIQGGDPVDPGQAIGYIEASKATSDLYAPMAGQCAHLNQEVLGNPELINTNLYDSGWLLAISGSAPALLLPEEYLAFLEAAWPLAQRLLKGQLGRS